MIPNACDISVNHRYQENGRLRERIREQDGDIARLQGEKKDLGTEVENLGEKVRLVVTCITHMTSHRDIILKHDSFFRLSKSLTGGQEHCMTTALCVKHHDSMIMTAL